MGFVVSFVGVCVVLVLLLRGFFGVLVFFFLLIFVCFFLVCVGFIGCGLGVFGRVWCWCDWGFGGCV